MNNETSLISWIDLFVTEKCNLNCKYCFHPQKPRDMSDETMQATINFFKDKITDNCIFNFFGGEPTLREDFCMKWFYKIKEFFPKCRVSTSTNAVLFPEKMISIMRRKDFDTQISYDGVYQEEYRGESKLVEKNIHRYVKEISGGNLHFRLTFMPETVHRLYDSIQMVYDLGGKRAAHQAVLSAHWEEKHFKEYEKQLTEIYKFLDEHKDFSSYFCTCDRVTNTRNSICSMGKGLIAVDAAGDIYPCHRSIKFPEFKIGNVHEKRFNRGRFKTLIIPECKGCIAEPTCHTCVIANYEINGSLVSNPASTCVINKIEYNKAFAKYKVENKEEFKARYILKPMLNVLNDIKDNNKEIIRVLKETKYARY